ncbi:histidinol-phosphatase [Pseudodesulfovibrio portus]|uniref:Histidinol-phosphatase n=2 Tax=Pseudodesulfovibrio portus TaxID=231439 RepID=A0ABM8AUX9_9BACT|nr:histidinol-phosphatase [Pseudodesulfovibrio portus]
MEPSDILSHARAKGLDGVCFTDHNTTEVLAQIHEGFQPDGLFVAVGMEYSTPQGDFLVFGDVEFLPDGLTGNALLLRVRDLGGAAVAAHPFRAGRSVDPSVFHAGLCHLIEVDNGRNSPDENERARSLALGRSMTSVAGSDAHRLDELGRYPTEFTIPVRSRADLVHALNNGLCHPARPCRMAI